MKKKMAGKGKKEKVCPLVMANLIGNSAISTDDSLVTVEELEKIILCVKERCEWWHKLLYDEDGGCIVRKGVEFLSNVISEIGLGD